MGEAERAAKAKSEKSRSDLARELEELAERLEDANGQTQGQIEVNKRREAELLKLQRDLEEHNIAHESTLSGLRKKHADLSSDMTEQIDNLQRVKQKLEKEKSELKMEADDLMSTVDSLTKSKVGYEKTCRNLEDVYAELKSKVEEQEKEISENAAAKARNTTEVNELKRTLEEKETVMDLENDKQRLEEKLKKAEFEHNQLATRYEDEQTLVAQLHKKIKELQARIEELEEELEAERAVEAEEAKTLRVTMEL